MKQVLRFEGNRCYGHQVHEADHDVLERQEPGHEGQLADFEALMDVLVQYKGRQAEEGQADDDANNQSAGEGRHLYHSRRREYWRHSDQAEDAKHVQEIVDESGVPCVQINLLEFDKAFDFQIRKRVPEIHSDLSLSLSLQRACRAWLRKMNVPIV